MESYYNLTKGVHSFKINCEDEHLYRWLYELICEGYEVGRQIFGYCIVTKKLL